MQAYSQDFAPFFNAELSNFAHRVAVSIEEFYSTTGVGATAKSVLDLCCGTGQLACELGRRGYQVVGVDASKPMLDYARRNSEVMPVATRPEFVHADILELSLDRSFGLVTCTYDSINHLENESELGRCSRMAYERLLNGGYFIFDLNTRASLRHWNTVSVTEKANCLVVTHGVYDGRGPKAVIRFAGCVRRGDNLYDRFEQVIYNSVFDMQQVLEVMSCSPWSRIYFARTNQLTDPIENPESIDVENGVTVVAQK